MSIEEIPQRTYWCDWRGHQIEPGEPYYILLDEDIRLCEKCAKIYAWDEFLKRAVQRTADEE